METVDNKRIGVLKFLVIPIIFFIVCIVFYGFVLSPKIEALKRLRNDVAQKEELINSIFQSIREFEQPDDFEEKSRSEVETRILAKFYSYELLNTLKELAYLAKKAGVDEIINISSPAGQMNPESSQGVVPIEHHLIKISFRTTKYETLLNFLSMMNNLNSLGDLESVSLSREPSGILNDITLRVYKVGEMHEK